MVDSGNIYSFTKEVAAFPVEWPAQKTVNIGLSHVILASLSLPCILSLAHAFAVKRSTISSGNYCHTELPVAQHELEASEKFVKEFAPFPGMTHRVKGFPDIEYAGLSQLAVFAMRLREVCGETRFSRLYDNSIVRLIRPLDASLRRATDGRVALDFKDGVFMLKRESLTCKIRMRGIYSHRTLLQLAAARLEGIQIDCKKVSSQSTAVTCSATNKVFCENGYPFLEVVTDGPRLYLFDLSRPADRCKRVMILQNSAHHRVTINLAKAIEKYGASSFADPGTGLTDPRIMCADEKQKRPHQPRPVVTASASSLDHGPPA